MRWKCRLWIWSWRWEWLWGEKQYYTMFKKRRTVSAPKEQFTMRSPHDQGIHCCDGGEIHHRFLCWLPGPNQLFRLFKSRTALPSAGVYVHCSQTVCVPWWFPSVWSISDSSNLWRRFRQEVCQSESIMTCTQTSTVWRGGPVQR